MKLFRNNLRAALVVSVLGLGLSLSVSNALGTSINYGDFIGNTVVFENVAEDSGTDPTPLYGAPLVSGDTLDFDPIGFESFSTGAGAIDITDGTLGLRVAAKPGNHIPFIDFSERGDYSLVGFSGDAVATVSATFFVNVMQVDGVDHFIDLGPHHMGFAPDGGSYALDDGGPTPIEQGVWSGNIHIDLTQELRDRGVNVGFVTLVTIVADNTLITASMEAGNSALIQKKDFSGLAIGVPEPGTTSILLLGAIVCSFARRIRRNA